MTPRLPAAEIEELKALLEKATPGPWRYDRTTISAYVWPEKGSWICNLVIPADCWHSENIEDNPGSHDARLIAAVRNALPALLAEIEAGRADAGRVRGLEAALRNMLPLAEAGTWRVLPDLIRSALRSTQSAAQPAAIHAQAKAKLQVAISDALVRYRATQYSADKIALEIATNFFAENAKNAQPAAERVWQPARTAPKDGHEFLMAYGGLDGSPPLVVAWSAEQECWLAVGVEMEVTTTPTHWMELPPPPAGDGAEG